MRKAQHVVTGWLLACFVSVGAVPALAESMSVIGTDTQEVHEGYWNGAFHKLGRGVTNSLFGWLEIPVQMDRRYNKRDTASGMVTGAFEGLFKGIGRTAVGLFETATFFIPCPRKGFAPILPTLPYFDKDKRESLPLN